MLYIAPSVRGGGGGGETGLTVTHYSAISSQLRRRRWQRQPVESQSLSGNFPPAQKKTKNFSVMHNESFERKNKRYA